MSKKEHHIRVNEIFKSIQGESTYAGIPCVFVRLTGCNLRCSYCDTTYAYNKGIEMSLSDIIGTINSYECRNVCITGGEPLLQENINNLINLLYKDSFNIYIETNGSLNIDTLPEGVVRIVDIKCPDSRMEPEIDWKNIKRLRQKDEVKFIISSKSDYEWAKGITKKHKIADRTTVLFGFVYGKLKPKTLAGWILKDGLDVRLHLQLHKIIWPDKIRGV
ncbi:organic radical activating enzyme [Candidatus Scalindua japonica]|uniref:7-carboxy-7-deazaguanine synthase n=1 Tax=Candidatus Scalindua japonica TaxID=1284222 RepID=A0A286TUL6_9BACT|nr:radical SAM protein [Candidatus Scalindua japonica]GAX59541.1 organic radical activating enzyme [Candidatus Scalindua japonica]